MFMKKNSSRVQDPIQPAQIGGKQHVIGKTYIPAKLDINDNVREEQITNNVINNISFVTIQDKYFNFF